MAIFEIAKNGMWSKKFREIDLFDFTRFFTLDFFNFLAHYDVRKLTYFSEKSFCFQLKTTGYNQFGEGKIKGKTIT